MQDNDEDTNARDREDKKLTTEERRRREQKYQGEKLWVLTVMAPIEDFYLDRFVTRLDNIFPKTRDRDRLGYLIAKWLVDQIHLHGEAEARRNMIACARNVLNDKISDMRNEIRACETEVAKLNTRLYNL